MPYVNHGDLLIHYELEGAGAPLYNMGSPRASSVGMHSVMSTRSRRSPSDCAAAERGQSSGGRRAWVASITNTCGERRDAGTRLPVQFVSSPGGSTSRLELEIASESPTTWPKAA
jgi:hypothetical protein